MIIINDSDQCRRYRATHKKCYSTCPLYTSCRERSIEIAMGMWKRESNKNELLEKELSTLKGKYESLWIKYKELEVVCNEWRDDFMREMNARKSCVFGGY